MKYLLVCLTQSLFLAAACQAASFPEPLILDSRWQMQLASEVSRPPLDIAWTGFDADDWHLATVPGTALTTLVDDGVYPEPLYGENNRPDKIPESLCRQSYWYRTVFRTPKAYAGQRILLHFDGINYSAEVWVNGNKAGTTSGAFARGLFDITGLVTPGRKTALAVLVSPPPHPGWPHEPTQFDGSGKNEGITTADGPSFFPTIGRDWMPAIRDRDCGIWQRVYLTAVGPVAIEDPLVTTELSVPDLDGADVHIQATVRNGTDRPQTGLLKARFGGVTVTTPVDVGPKGSNVVRLGPKAFSQLRVKHPRLWWPNGYGPQNLYKLDLDFEIEGRISDHKEMSFGIRKISYSVAGSDELALSVNGARLLCRGGDWGMDEAMKRNPRSRLDAELRMHQGANLTMVRNRAGQSTSEDFYDLCDQYGLLVWDEFFQAGASEGPEPTDAVAYLANARDKVLRFRNHPCIALWCARAEGQPAKDLGDALRKLMAELEPTRLYLASTEGKGIGSRGPYHWRPPREYYDFGSNEVFETEIGSVSIPTLDSIHGMMPDKDWEAINDDWAEHGLAKGAQQGDEYPRLLNDRYGKVTNLADFVRKGQLANYEAYRAMFEARNAEMFKPCTGVLTWMSNPAQPSFVWQLYHHDLEPNSSLFAVQKACETLHIQLNEKTGGLEAINNLAGAITNSRAELKLYNLDGSNVFHRQYDVEAPAMAATDLGPVDWPTNLSAVHFVKLEWRGSDGKLLSDNFYWRGAPGEPDNLQGLGKLRTATIQAEVARFENKERCLLEVRLRNPGTNIALMTHLQLRRRDSRDRVLPVFYSDNYVSLAPGETRMISIEAAADDLKHQKPLILMDGWNIAVKPSNSPDAEVALNDEAQVGHWPASGLPVHIQ